MKISVITVCLNAQQTIEATLESVFNQSYPNIELIVIDGGSTDSTNDIINKYSEKISYYCSEPDNGVYDAMNKGIRVASGDFVFFLNANDTFSDDSVLQKVVDIMRVNPNAEIFFGDVNYLSENGEFSRISNHKHMKNPFSFAFKNICHQCIFYKRELFEKIGYYSNDFKIYSDWDFNVKCFFVNKVSSVYMPFVISNFRQGGVSSSEKHKALFWEERMRILKKYYPLFLPFIIVKNYLKRKMS